MFSLMTSVLSPKFSHHLYFLFDDVTLRFQILMIWKVQYLLNLVNWQCQITQIQVITSSLLYALVIFILW